MNSYVYDLPIGRIIISDDNKKIISLNLIYEDVFRNDNICETPLIKETYKQLVEYFDGKRKIFDVPISLEGTKFQIEVWNNLIKIPYGSVQSYRDIAEKIGNDNAQRAIGNACNKNKIMILVPCHRVISSNGKIGGFGAGTKIKEYLLRLEGNKWSEYHE